MNNINWKIKYSVYPFEYPNGVEGQVIIKDKGGIQVVIKDSKYEVKTFKNFEKAMSYVQSELSNNLK